MVDIALGGFALFVCFYQAYRVGMDEKVIVKQKKELALLKKQVKELQTQMNFLLQPVEEEPMEGEGEAPEASPSDIPSKEEESEPEPQVPSLLALKGDREK